LELIINELFNQTLEVDAKIKQSLNQKNKLTVIELLNKLLEEEKLEKCGLAYYIYALNEAVIETMKADLNKKE
jgi:hypothetical protein